MIKIVRLSPENRPVHVFTSTLFSDIEVTTSVFDDLYPDATAEDITTIYTNITTTLNNPNGLVTLVNPPDFDSFVDPIWDGSTWIEGKSSVDILNDDKLSANQQIDAYAEHTRWKFITPGAGQSMAYQEKSDEAADYISAGYPADLTGYPFIQAEVNATGKTSTQAADDIIAQKAAWIAVGASIEEIRLAGKKAITDATDKTGVNTAVTTATTALDAL